MDLWEDDVPWGNMAITSLKVITDHTYGHQNKLIAQLAMRAHCLPRARSCMELQLWGNMSLWPDV
jgi:hypothetical protein